MDTGLSAYPTVFIQTHISDRDYNKKSYQKYMDGSGSPSTPKEKLTLLSWGIT